MSQPRFSRFQKPILEVLEDRYVLDAWGLNLDFGVSNSPPATGYQQVLLKKFDPAIGYGWSDITELSAVDRSATDTTALDRAFHAGRRGTFNVNVPNGEYQVTIRMGDPAGSIGGVVGVLENRYLFSNTPTSVGQITEQTLKVTVTDNQLNLLLLSRGGTNPVFALNSMKLVSTTSNLPPVNQAPTNLALSGNSILENRPAGTLIGTFSTTDPNLGDTHTYTFVDGTGSADNSLFTLSGNQLTANGAFDFEFRSTYSIRIKTTDAGGLSFEKAFTINVQNANEAPTSITLSNNVLPKSMRAGTLIGLFSTKDPDQGDTFRYSLVAGPGSTDNSRFVAQGNSLKTKTTVSAGTYSIRVRSTDAGGLSTDQTFTIIVNGGATNQQPTDLSLSGTSILENRPAGTVVGSLSTTDPNPGDTFTYSLVTGTGSTDNGLFTIVGNQLQANTSLDFEAQSTRSVRIKTTDAGGLSFEKAYTINVQNVNEAPTSVTLSNSVVAQNTPAGTIVGQFLTTDPDLGDTFAYALVPGTGSTSNSSFAIQNSSLKTLSSLAPGSYSIRVRSMDAGGLFTERALTVTATNAPSNQLVNQSNLQYLGAFRVPNYHNDIDGFSYGGHALAYNPSNNSLFISGLSYGLAEISIPQPVNSSNLDDYSTANVLQSWTTVLDRIPNKLTNALDGALLGGITVYDGKLIGTQYAYYSGAQDQTTSHFVMDSLNLASANVSGLYQVGNWARAAAGYMSPIPSEWQNALGATYLTGLSGVPIITTTSAGPAAFGFDPSQLTGPVSNAIPAIPYLNYPSNQPQLGDYTGPVNPIQNGNTSTTGVVFVPGSSSVLFFGKTGTNYSGYGTSQEWNDPNDGGKGPHSLNGEYAYQILAYDANDFVAVKQGHKQPWELRPYNSWNFDFPYSQGYKQSGGVAFDPSTGRIYMVSMNQDHEDMYSSLPLIQVFQINLSPSTPLTAPQIGTLAATPNPVLAGPVPAGTIMTLSAGNVYSIIPQYSITQVAFYYDNNNDGILDKNVDQLLGYGSPINENHVSSVQISTSGMNSGTHTIFAQAIDIANQLGNIVKAKFTIM